MALKPVESNVVSNLSEIERRVLDTIDDAIDLLDTYTALGMDASLTNNDLDAGNFKFTKAQLTASLTTISALKTLMTPTERAKLMLVARQRNLR